MTKLRIPVVRFSDGSITAHASPNLINGELVLSDEDALNAVIRPESIPVGIWWVEVDVPDVAPSLSTGKPTWEVDIVFNVRPQTSQEVGSATTCQHCSAPAGGKHHEFCPAVWAAKPLNTEVAPPFHKSHKPHIGPQHNHTDYCDNCGAWAESEIARNPCKKANA